jgi:hypothetical protein
LNVAAGGHVGLADFHAEHLKPHARKLNRVAALEAPQVGDADAALVARKHRLEDALRGHAPGMIRE